MTKNEIINSFEKLSKSNPKYAKLVNDVQMGDENAVELIEYLESKHISNEIDLILEMGF